MNDIPESTRATPPKNRARPARQGSPIHIRTSGLHDISSPPIFSPTATTPNYNLASSAVRRETASRHSSVSSTNSLPSRDHATRSTTAAGSPRTAASVSSLGPGGTTVLGASRLIRHSPSLSQSISAGSPVSSPRSASSSSQLSSLLVTQLNILLSTIKDDTDRTKWAAQAERIRRLVHDSGMELFTTYFRRLLQGNAPAIFPGTRAAPAGQDSAGSYQLLAEEMQKISREPQQADKIAESLDASEGELFRDFDLTTFVDHFQLDGVSKVALALACRTTSKADLRTKADALIVSNFQTCLQNIAQPQMTEPETELSPLVLSSIVERLLLDPPQDWDEGERENLPIAIKLRYNNQLRKPVPPVVEAAMYLAELLASQDARMARIVQRAGPRATATVDACKEMLQGVETRDISYNQVASALLFMAIVQNGDAYNAGNFVDALRQHRAGAKIDWTDVVQGFDREHLRITKKQFLVLFNALSPLARVYANFDIQLLWGSQWQYPDTQLSFVVAFLATTPEELDVRQIPNLRQCFDLSEFENASPSIKEFAAKAITHPLVSRDATEALFSMIFRSQEAYSIAQMLGIPDTVINQNMPVFVCAASAIPKPWAPLQDQALKQLLFPFVLKQHDNFDFVMHSLWEHDRTWLAGRLLDFYQQDTMLLTLIFEHAQQHGWVEALLTLPSPFAIDLAAYAHGKNACNLEDWAQQLLTAMNPIEFARALYGFLKVKIDDEGQHIPPTTTRLAIKTVHTLLLLIADNVPDEQTGQLFRQCLQTYPRLFNYGEDATRDALLDANNQIGHALPDNATKEMENQYKAMYGGSTTPDDVVTELNRLKVSEDAADQDLFAAMLFGLFEEYNCFGEYPMEALATTAVLFGGLVARHVLSGIAEQAAIYMMFEAASEFGQDDSMYKFGLQALIHCIPRLKEWPSLAERIVHAPSLRNTQVWSAAEGVVKELQQDSMGMNGDGANGITNGALEDDFSAEAAIPPFSAIQVDPPIREDFYEEPDEDISDKVMFVLNNVSKRNLDEKFKEIESALEDKYHQWFAHYLVEELAKSQPNFQSLYLSVLDKFNKKVLWAEVLRETYMSCQKMLNAQSTMDSQHERTTLKNLAVWLGSITLARNVPILHRNLSFRELLLEGYDTQRQLVAIPFTCKTLAQAANSKVFRPPNPWIVEILGILAELYHATDLKLNMKFEIEMLFRDFQLEMTDIPTAEVIRSRPLLDQTMLQSYMPDGPDAFGDMALMGLSKRGPNERFSPDAVIQAVPDLGGMLQIPQAVGAITQQQMRNIFVNAAQQAIYEIIAPVVERSVTIASISTSELIQKDFNTEGDLDKMRESAHTMVKALSGSLALVTCKEPLRMSITNNIRILASRSLPDQLPEGQILMFVNDNIDTVCSLVEHAAEEHSLAEIDLQLQQAFEDRRQHNEQRPNEPFSQQPISRWATLIPDPYRQDQHGLNRQQLGLYDDFGRVARLTPASHANNISQDSSRQLPDVLSEGYLPNLPTPAEVPAMPRPPQQRPPQLNGYMDNANIGQRIMELMEELQQTSREAPEEHISEIGEGARIRQVYGQLVGLIESAPAIDPLAITSGMQCLNVIYNTAQKRLEIEVFVRLLTQLCRMSGAAGRNITMQLAIADDDRMLNAAATVALHNEGLIELQHIDTQVARAIESKRHVVLDFLKDILNELLLGENPASFRTDFVLTYDALSEWLREDSAPALGREIMNKLQLPASQVNGMPSPDSDSNIVDQHEYVFEEWVRLQRKDVPEHTQRIFIQQMHDRQVLSQEEEAIKFFRACLDMSCAEYDRISIVPYATMDQAYVHVDALARLIAMVVVYHDPEELEGRARMEKSRPLAALLRLVILVMNDHHRRYHDRFSSRVYFRLFSTLLCEIHGFREQLPDHQVLGIFTEFANALHVLQPRYFPGFMHGWLSLLGHRLFISHFLDGSGRTNGGWDTYTRLVHVLLTNLGLLLSMPDVPPVAQDYYRGVLRFFLALHHDFPEFLAENHMQLDSSVPTRCIQLLNIVNSAVPRALSTAQPDPFMPGLKINRLEPVRQAPAVHSAAANVLDEAGVKATVDRICNGGDFGEQDFTAILSAVDRADGQVSPILINALMLYVAVHATSANSVFSSAAAPAKLLERLLRESGERARHCMVNAMVNQVRYINAHTYYFITALGHMFSVGSLELQDQIMLVLCERAMSRPHPWGIIVILLEMIKNPAYDLFKLPFMQGAPQVEHMLMGLSRQQEQAGSHGVW